VAGEEFFCGLKELGTRRALVGAPELFRRRELALLGVAFARVVGVAPRFSALPATSLTTQLHSTSLKYEMEGGDLSRHFCESWLIHGAVRLDGLFCPRVGSFES
jgi:hypothetical protein